MKPRVLNFGSINIDYIYKVPSFVTPGETLSSLSLHTGLGGKGANQSAAIANAGVAVEHFGRISKQDAWAVEKMAGLGVGVANIELVNEPSGHAIIQVDPNGENAIVLHGGANKSFELGQFSDTISALNGGDYLLMQNECNLLSQAFDLARQHKLKIVFNPAPMNHVVSSLPLHEVDILIINQIEAEAISGYKDLDDIIRVMTKKAPHTMLVITLGSKGAVLVSAGNKIFAHTAAKKVVDTTAAGDTFVGYFVAGLVDGLDEGEALDRACQAGAITVSRSGAIDSIPLLQELSK